MGKKFTVRQYIGDGIICISLVLVILIASALVLGTDKGSNEYVKILHDGNQVAVLALSEDVSDFKVGNVHVAVTDGRAYIKKSDCPDKVCMGMHGVSENGGGAVCIPNKVVLEPQKKSGNIDVVAG